MGDSSGRRYVTEQGHNVPLLRTRVLEYPFANHKRHGVNLIIVMMMMMMIIIIIIIIIIKELVILDT